jgi:hypothetical protein
MLHSEPSAQEFAKVTIDYAIEGTTQIRVIYTLRAPFIGATAPPDELPIEDILTVKHDVIPLDGAEVLQQGSIDSIGERIALAEDSGDLPRLPVDDARQDQVQGSRHESVRIVRFERAQLGQF